MKTELLNWLLPWRSRREQIRLQEELLVLRAECNYLRTDMNSSRQEMRMAKEALESQGHELARFQNAQKAANALVAWIKRDRKLDEQTTETVVRQILQTQTK